jgi:hypothetical protein
MESFKRIGQEQNNFIILERNEGGISMIFKVPPDLKEKFERIAAHVPNAKFHLAAGFADPDGHTAIRNISLGNREVAAINFASSAHKNQQAYKITHLST